MQHASASNQARYSPTNGMDGEAGPSMEPWPVMSSSQPPFSHALQPAHLLHYWTTAAPSQRTEARHWTKRWGCCSPGQRAQQCRLWRQRHASVPKTLAQRGDAGVWGGARTASEEEAVRSVSGPQRCSDAERKVAMEQPFDKSFCGRQVACQACMYDSKCSACRYFLPICTSALLSADGVRLCMHTVCCAPGEGDVATQSHPWPRCVVARCMLDGQRDSSQGFPVGSPLTCARGSGSGQS